MMSGTRVIMVAVSCLLVSSGFATERVVLESNTPAYVPGETFEATSPIMLTERQFIVIATDDGRVVRIEGPHAGPAEGPPLPRNAIRELLDRLLGGSSDELGGLAGVRGGDDRAAVASARSRPNPWSIDALQTGDQCYVRDRPLELWRDATAVAARGDITEVATGREANVAWDRNTALTPWPSAIEPTDAGIYLIRVEHSIRAVAVRLHELQPTAVERDFAAVAWLAAKGCLAQARGLMSQSRDLGLD